MEQITIYVVGDLYGSPYSQTYKETLDSLKSLEEQGFHIKEGETKMVKVGPLLELDANIIVTGISALSAVISALIAYLATRKTGTIKLVGGDNIIEIPKDTPKEDIEYYIQKAKELGVSEITLQTYSGRKYTYDEVYKR